MEQTAILIGTPALCRRLHQQLGEVSDPPIVLGWVLCGIDETVVRQPVDANVLGMIAELESICATRKPASALLSLPAVMKDQIAAIRTRLRRLGVADRFMPTLEDQIAGVGPRTHLDIDLSQLLDRTPKQMDEGEVAPAIRGKRVLITGAGGSIGSELARLVAQFEPAEVQLMERSENALFEIDRQLAQCVPNQPRRAILHDVVEAEKTRGWFEQLKPDIVFHAAAHKHVPMMEDHPAAAVDNNVFGTKSVVDASHAAGVDRFVMISSDKAVNPVSIMGVTKRLAELYVQHLSQHSRTGFSTVRFGNVLASSGSVLETWSRQIAAGGPLTVTDPRMTRYFMTIPEAASLVIQSMALLDRTLESGEVFLLDMGDPLRIVDLAGQFARLHGLEPRLPGATEEAVPGSIQVVYTGVRPGEKLHEELAFDAECMRPTRHPDINIWTLTPPDSRYIEQMIQELAPGNRPDDPAELGRAVREALPTRARSVAAA
ncbi:MAG: polysaccharide biosynthesis protein [Phycisphaerales bacterium]|nr:MAG: polysaccharide biosynthesis protein [Phycisphaerales bacterium]